MCNKYIDCFKEQCDHDTLTERELQILLEKWSKARRITLKKGQKLKFTELEDGSIKVEIVDP